MADLADDRVSIGEGFAFFRWHIRKYGCEDWLFPHHADEQKVCRAEFRKLNPQTALDVPKGNENV